MSDGSGRLQYVVGAYYRDLHQDSGRTITVADLFGVTAPLPLGASNPPVIQDTTVRFHESEIAAFGELTYAVLPKVKVAAGARVFSYRQREASRRYGIGGITGGDLAYDYDERNREHGVTPRFTLSYEPSRAATLYASYSQGFRTGGVNAPITDDICSAAERRTAGIPDVPPPYDSDRTDNYEVGAKTSLWGGRLRINAAAYAIEWKNYQQAFQTACGINNATTISFTVNAGRVRSGAGSWKFLSRLSVGSISPAGGAFIDATYRNAVPNLLLPAGSRVLDVPRWTWERAGQLRRSARARTDGQSVRGSAPCWRNQQRASAKARCCRVRPTRWSMRLPASDGAASRSTCLSPTCSMSCRSLARSSPPRPATRRRPATSPISSARHERSAFA